MEPRRADKRNKGQRRFETRAVHFRGTPGRRPKRRYAGWRFLPDLHPNLRFYHVLPPGHRDDRPGSGRRAGRLQLRPLRQPHRRRLRKCAGLSRRRRPGFCLRLRDGRHARGALRRRVQRRVYGPGRRPTLRLHGDADGPGLRRGRRRDPLFRRRRSRRPRKESGEAKTPGPWW